MSPDGISVLIGISTTALVLALVTLWTSPYMRISRRVRRGSSSSQNGGEHVVALFRTDAAQNRGLTALLSPLSSFILQSGLPVTTHHVLAAAMATGGITLASGIQLFSAPIALLLGFASTVAPLVVIAFARQKRIARIEKQLPEAFDIMKRALGAGQSVPSAITQVASHCRGPVAEEFQRTVELQDLGLAFEDALRGLAQRVPSAELQMLVMALIMQRQSGGSPVEILENAASLTRKRQRMARRIRTLTTEGRMQAVILIALPLVVFSGLSLLRPDYISPLLNRPTVLAWLLLMQLAGTLWIRQVTRLEY